MALFGRKTEDTKQAAAASTSAGAVARDLSRVLVRPRVTEKAMLVNDKRVYVFDIARAATKYDVRDAVIVHFKVTPAKIAIVNRKPQAYVSRARGRRGLRPGLKKAYVYLKEGDRIDLV